jgi:uncharacterized protein YjiS (DUF1127 family)
MRFELQSFSDAMIPPVRESAGQGDWADTNRRGEWIAVSRERLLRASPDRAGLWRSVFTATSVVMAHALAGLAWGAFVMYPSLLGSQPGQADDEECADDPSFVAPVRDCSVTQGAAMQSRILHSEETPFIANELVVFEGPAIPGGSVPPGPERSGLRSFQTWVSAMPARLWTRTVRAHRNRRAIAELQALDDRMLKDIGVSRSQIWSVVTNGGDPRL